MSSSFASFVTGKGKRSTIFSQEKCFLIDTKTKSYCWLKESFIRKGEGNQTLNFLAAKFHHKCCNAKTRITSVAEFGSDGMTEQAHILLEQLYDQGIVLGHPTLNADLHDATLLSLPLKSYGAEKEDEDKPGIRWEWRRGYRGSREITAIENQLRTHEPALLAAISDRIVQQRLRAVQGTAQSLVKALGVTLQAPKKQQALLEGSIPPLPLKAERIWKLYEDEYRHLDGYPGAWEQLSNQILALDQVFVDG
jgi:hypothetical protein